MSAVFENVSSDMASELYNRKKQSCSFPENIYTSEKENGILTETLTVSDDAVSAQLGKSIGTYYTVHTGTLRYAEEDTYRACRAAVQKVLCKAVRSLLPDFVPPDTLQNGMSLHPYSVLCVGLGNEELTADALGTWTVHGLIITKHLTDAKEASPLGNIPLHPLAGFCPMVLGQTGIETCALVRGAADACNPDLVLLVDALAAAETDSMFRTVQISTTGIHPGGGVGNQRNPLTAESLGIPVLTIGVPTVISAASIITDALYASDVPKTTVDYETLTKTWRGNYVTTKDADSDTREYARLLSLVINGLFLGEKPTDAWFRRV